MKISLDQPWVGNVQEASGNLHASAAKNEDGKVHDVHIVWGSIEDSDASSSSNGQGNESKADAECFQRPGNVLFLDSSSSHPSAPEDDVKNSPRKEVAASNLPSVGSAFHVTNNCKPCLFTRKSPNGCTSGYECRFCHFPHEQLRKTRPCKTKRERYKKHLLLMGMVQASQGDSSISRQSVGEL